MHIPVAITSAAPATLFVVAPGLPGMPRSNYTDNLVAMTRAAKSYGAQLVPVLPTSFKGSLPPEISPPLLLDAPHRGDELARAARTHVPRVTQILPLREAMVIPAAQASSELTLEDPVPALAALRARDKLTMKTALMAAGLDVADFTALDTLDGLEAFARKHNYHVVVKPREDASCLGTHLIHTEADVKQVWDAIQSSAETYIAEAFVDVAAEYHSNLIVRGGKAVFHGLGKYSSPLLQDLFACDITRHLNLTPIEASIKQMSLRVLRALGIEHEIAPAHIEYLVTSDGRLLVGEAALRLPGGAIVSLFEHTTGVNMAAAWIHALLNPHYTAEQTTPQHDLASELIGLNEAVKLEEIPSLEALQQEAPEIVALLQWADAGDTIPAALGSSANRFASVFFNVDPNSNFADTRKKVRDLVYGGLRVLPLRKAV